MNSALPKQSIWAGLALSCMFSGIWLSDSVASGAFTYFGGDLVMRLISLLVYLVAFVLAFGLDKKAISRAQLDANLLGRKLTDSLSSSRSAQAQADDTRLKHRLLDHARHSYLVWGISAALLLFIAAIAILSCSGGLAVSHCSFDTPGIVFMALVFLKLIGAPLSIALVYLLVRQSPERLSTTIACGILGAFLIFGFVSYLTTSHYISQIMKLVLGTVLLFLACLLAIDAITTLPVRSDQEERMDGDKLSLRKVVSGNLAASMAVMAFMLGYLRARQAHEDPTAMPAIYGILLLILLICFFGKVGLRELFRSALLCTAGGFLLAPIFELINPHLPLVFSGIGTALLESVVWITAVLIARSCVSSFLAAALCRLVMVLGHFVGSLLASFAWAWSLAHHSGEEAASLLLVFIYLVMLIYLFNEPTARLFFLPTEQLQKAKLNIVHASRVVPKALSEQEDDEDEDLTDAEREVKAWRNLCGRIAQEYGLTPREIDVLELLARGRDIGFIEERLVLSRNTVKMHIKHIYSKAGVHSKQELIDLVDAARASGC